MKYILLRLLLLCCVFFLIPRVSASLNRNDSTTPLPTQPTSPDVEFSRWFCYEGRKPVPQYRTRCCAIELGRYLERWYSGGYYLTTLLERLERWKCDEFIDECTNPSFNFTEFTKLVYDRFCNRTEMESACSPVLQTTLKRYGLQYTEGVNSANSSYEWLLLTEALRPKEMELIDLTKPCVEIALFDRPSGGVGRFHEIVEPYFPFCGLHWEGFDIETAMNKDVSIWTVLSPGCKGAVAFFMALMVFAGLATVVLNLTILIALITRLKARNSQTTFRMSLAVADFVVGLMVWPNMVVMQVVMFIYPRKMGDIVTLERQTRGNRTAYFPNFDDGLERRYPGGSFPTIFGPSYRRYFGFFTILGLTVSIFTLMAASFDRLFAVSRPFKYRMTNPRRNAKIFCMVIWILSIGVCVLPATIEEMEFSVSSSIFIAAHGIYGQALLLITFILPLCVTWIVSIATYMATRKHTKKRNKRLTIANKTEDNTERRLAKTLILMVGVFSISVVPAILCLISAFFVPVTDWKNPKSLNIYSANIYVSTEYIVIIILTANSLWNCFIYSLRNKDFRKACQDIYRKLCRLGFTKIQKGVKNLAKE